MLSTTTGGCNTTGVRSDHTVILTSFESASVYPDAFRRATYLDVEAKKRFRSYADTVIKGGSAI